MESPNRIKFHHINKKYKKQTVSLQMLFIIDYILKPRGEKHVKLNFIIIANIKKKIHSILLLKVNENGILLSKQLLKIN